MQKCVVFGGRGYIGQSFVPLLAKQFPGVHIVLASRHQQALPKPGSTVSSEKCDVTDPDDIMRIAADADMIVNLVGIMDAEPPKYTFEAVQHRAPSVMARIVADRVRQGKRGFFLHLSALGADSQSTIPYAKTKGLGEEAIMDAFKDIDRHSATIIRPGLVISPHDQFLNV